MIVSALFLSISVLPFFTSQTLKLPANEKSPVSTFPKEPEFAPLSIERVFGSDHSLPLGINPGDLRVLIITGDVIPARGVNIEAIRRGWTFPWQETMEFLKTGDLTIINLEAPLLKNCPILGEGFKFCGDARNIEGLLAGGVDMASLENNHITNFGFQGLNETIALLESRGIAWGRRDHLGIKEVRGMKFGLLGFNGVGERIDREGMAEEIKKARSQVDVLMAEFHWGKEYERLPLTDGSIAPDDPRELARMAIDNGVDLVIGNHPHWTQGVEFYRDHFIPYAHGNFIFDQMWSEETRIGVVGKYTFYKNKLVDVQFFPTKLYYYSQPRFLEGEEAAVVLTEMKKASLQLQNLTQPR
ncbi:MAG TPA: CapA family protein [Patescibacteria group bacterium]|nr:CapA family protein [Patescibacteria group bacterium]